MEQNLGRLCRGLLGRPRWEGGAEGTSGQGLTGNAKDVERDLSGRDQGDHRDSRQGEGVKTSRWQVRVKGGTSGTFPMQG